MSLILIGVFTLGIALSKGMLLLGVTSMAVRYTCSAILGYGLFFIGVRLWLWYVLKTSPSFESGADLALDAADCALEATGMSGQCQQFTPGGGSADSISAEGLIGGLDDGAAIIIAIVALLVLVAGLLGASIYLVVEAPLILSEAAFQLMLAATLRRGAKAIDETGWKGSVLKATWKPALVAVLAALVAGVTLDLAFPMAATVREVFEIIQKLDSPIG